MSADSPMPTRLGAYVPAFFRVLLGVLFLTVWASNLHKGLYGGDDYAALIRSYVDEGNSPEPWKWLMRGVADAASVTSKAQLVAELVLGVCLLLGIGTRLAGVGAGLFLTALWISELGVPGEWAWSLVFPAVLAFAVALDPASRRLSVDERLTGRLAHA